MSHLLALMLCVASLQALAGAGSWHGLGPTGGNVGHIIADVDSPDTFYAETRAGVFRSVDRGATWTAAQQGLGATSNSGGGVGFGLQGRTLISSSGAIYAVGQGCRTLYRSTDRAETWTPTGFVANACITALTMTSGPTPRLLVATAASELLASTDDGATFTPTGSGLPTGFTMHSLAANPNQPGIVLSIPRDPATPNPNIHVSSDGGDSWMPYIQTGPFPITVYPYSQFSFGAGSTVYLASFGIFRSDDGGLNWTMNVFTEALTIIAAHPENPDDIYYVGAVDGHVHFSQDNGATSTPVSVGHVMANPVDSATISTLVLDRAGTDDNLLVGTADVGIFKRTAGSWTSSNAGIHATPVRAIALHPLADGHLLAGVADVATPSSGVLRSIDAGVSWEPANTGLRARNVRSIAIDQTSAASPATTIVYAAGTATTTANAGIWKSSDGGTQWTPIAAGLPQPTAAGIVRNLVIDPRSCTSPPPAPAHCLSGPLSTLYAAGSGTVGATTTHRLIRSTDAGANWTDIDGLPQRDSTNGMQSVSPVALALDPLDTQRLFVGTLASISAPEATIPNGVFMSLDGGAHWTLRSNGLPLYPGSAASTHHDVPALAIDPHTAGTLWAATSVFAQSERSVIYRSTDAGANWAPSSAGITAGDIRHIVVEPTGSGTLYAAAAGFLYAPAGIYKSSDGGDSWRSISVGLDGYGTTTLSIDPLDPGILYAGTRSGVFVLQQVADTDGDGVPDTIEQAGPAGGDGNGDGIPDYQQSNVATIDLASDAGRWRAHERASPSGPGNGFLTIAVSAVNPGTCSQLVDAQAVRPGDRPGDVDSDGIWAHDMPLVRFEILDCPAADVTLTWSTADFDDTDAIRFFGPQSIGMDDMRWLHFGPASERLDARSWRIELTAGAIGSYRPLASGAILFEGGPASADRIFRQGFE